ncbi:MAG: hypothetical protein GKR95_20755 [Gammaproteobacteria bacterium]|nr:hypothetical protein [Gammaproteobacteria bacterium]
MVYPDKSVQSARRTLWFRVTKAYLERLAGNEILLDDSTTKSELIRLIRTNCPAIAGEPLIEMLEYEELLDQIVKTPKEEAVPAEMLGLFSEEQWPQLLIEFQPSFHHVQMSFNTVEQYNKISSGEPGNEPTKQMSQWIIHNDGNSTIVRKITSQQSAIIDGLLAQKNLEQVGEQMGEGITLETLIIDWLNQGLIIDIGVPVPDDATYESTP